MLSMLFKITRSVSVQGTDPILGALLDMVCRQVQAHLRLQQSPLVSICMRLTLPPRGMQHFPLSLQSSFPLHKHDSPTAKNDVSMHDLQCMAKQYNFTRCLFEKFGTMPITGGVTHCFHIIRGVQPNNELPLEPNNLYKKD